MNDDDAVEEFSDQVEALERSLTGLQGAAETLDGELGAMQSSLSSVSTQVRGVNRSLSTDLRRSFEGLIFDGDKLSDVLRSVGDSFTRSIYRAAVKPAFNQLGSALGSGVESLLSGLFSAGAGFAQGRVMPFATGGVVQGPTAFPMRGGVGLMGEAGPEAILPLARGANGRLGVEVQGGSARPVSVVINVTTPDVAGFERSQSQIAAQIARSLSRGNRNR